MGEFAGYALDETMDMEEWRAQELPPNHPVHPLFEWLTPTEQSLQQESFELLAMLDGSAGRFSNLERTFAQSYSTSLVAVAKKYQQTWQMRLGMAEQVCKGKPLTTKQRAWMETNWKGGTIMFEQQIQDKKTLSNLRKMTAAVNNLASK